MLHIHHRKGNIPDVRARFTLPVLQETFQVAVLHPPDHLIQPTAQWLPVVLFAEHESAPLFLHLP